jgi:hypothetical protein
MTVLQEFTIDAERSFIGAWHMNDPTICDRLIEHFETADYPKTPGRGSDGLINLDRKESTDMRLRLTEAVAGEYVEELRLATMAYIEKYPTAGETDPWTIENINLQKYDSGGGYKMWHTERAGSGAHQVYRHLVFMTYLNDVIVDGETEFRYQNIKVKPKKGLTLIWPSDWTHTHRGIITPEIKYIATGWFRFISMEQAKQAIAMQ